MADKDVCENWHFVYQDITYPDLPQYPSGYYLNLKTKETYGFKEGIKNIVGEDNEMYIYNMWYFDQ